MRPWPQPIWRQFLESEPVTQEGELDAQPPRTTIETPIRTTIETLIRESKTLLETLIRGL